MAEKLLSEVLKDAGFICVDGGKQHPDRGEELQPIHRGKSYTYGHWNGVYAIYDEDCRAWVIQRGIDWAFLRAQGIEIGLIKPGANVPNVHFSDL